MRYGGKRTGANVYDIEQKREDNPEQHYERSGSPAMSYLVLSVLLAVVCFIAAMAVWTSA
jgi:hypothetical protein